MTRKVFLPIFVMLPFIVFFVAYGELYGFQERLRVIRELTAEERKLASVLAKQAIERRKLRTIGKLYLVEIELYRDKEAEEQRILDRKAIVTHYRYDGDLTILAIVNLSRREVIQVKTFPHLPVPLSEEEFALAKQLAASHPDVKTIMESYGERITVEALITRTTMRDDPIFGHRVVRLLFRVGSDYLSEPIVNVDLTTEKVMIEKTKKNKQ